MVISYSQNPSLKKTSEEKIILKNIKALEESLEHESNPEIREAIASQISELRNMLLQPKQELSIKVEAKRFDENIAKLYELLLKRYAEMINEHEKKTVGGIKALVNKTDLTIQSAANNIAGENYRFESHYAQAAERAYCFVRDEIEYVKPDLNIYFWLTPTEIISEKIGDDEDQAVFLCSLLYALGDEKAEVVIAELENAKSHAFVITEFNNQFLLLDPCQTTDFREFYGEKKEILEKFTFEGVQIKKFLFKFNNTNYEQFREDEE